MQQTTWSQIVWYPGWLDRLSDVIRHRRVWIVRRSFGGWLVNLRDPPAKLNYLQNYTAVITLVWLVGNDTPGRTQRKSLMRSLLQSFISSMGRGDMWWNGSMSSKDIASPSWIGRRLPGHTSLNTIGRQFSKLKLSAQMCQKTAIIAL